MNSLDIKGVNYDVGIKFSSNYSTRKNLDSSTMMRELRVIKDELNCNAVRIYGDNLDRLLECTKIAINENLSVWFSPRLINVNQEESSKFIFDCANEIEKIRKDYPGIVFVIGTKQSLDVKGFTKGNTLFERISYMFKPINLIKNNLGFGVNKELNKFLMNVVSEVRQIFKGNITYAAGHWEKINWDIFDLISVNYYRNKYNASRYKATLNKITKKGKKVAITEFGCCSYQGAEDKGAWGYSIVDRSGQVTKLNNIYVRDENIQAKYIIDLLNIYKETNVYAAFVFNFITPDSRYNENPEYDLDMADFGILKVLPDETGNANIPYLTEKKAAFFEISKFYSNS